MVPQFDFPWKLGISYHWQKVEVLSRKLQLPQAAKSRINTSKIYSIKGFFMKLQLEEDGLVPGLPKNGLLMQSVSLQSKVPYLVPRSWIWDLHLTSLHSNPLIQVHLVSRNQTSLPSQGNLPPTSTNRLPRESCQGSANWLKIQCKYNSVFTKQTGTGLEIIHLSCLLLWISLSSSTSTFYLLLMFLVIVE